ncbi:MAG: exosortase T [Candidatus Competibacterales bacterium]
MALYSSPIAFHHIGRRGPSPGTAPLLLTVAAAALLGFEPLVWLIHTWLDPAYASTGFPVALLTAGLLAASLLSGPPRGRPRPWWGWLALAVALRGLGQGLGVNTLAAGTLIIDLYVLALATGVDRRPLALAPGFLALLFALSLPLERILQRLVGFGLQQLAADGACWSLGWFLPDLHCHGVIIALEGQNLVVDLPCSGSQALVMLLVIFAVLGARQRPTLPMAALGLAIALGAAWVSNVVRICAIALALAFDTGLDPLAAPWHDVLGLATLLLGAVPLWLWARRVEPAVPVSPVPPVPSVPPGAPLQPGQPDPQTPSSRCTALWGKPLGLLLAALGIVLLLPTRPVDVARPGVPPVLPHSLAALPGAFLPLTPLEQTYFTRYGGAAARAVYGPFALMAVHTQAPLRHLHAPDECLRGSGHRVSYQGLSHEPLPSAVYKTTDPQGRTFRIAVTFIADDGRTATSVAEAVWHWLAEPTVGWTQLQRISPWETDPYLQAHRRDFEWAVARAFDQAPYAPGLTDAATSTPASTPASVSTPTSMEYDL